MSLDNSILTIEEKNELKSELKNNNILLKIYNNPDTLTHVMKPNNNGKYMSIGTLSKATSLKMYELFGETSSGEFLTINLKWIVEKYCQN